MIEARFPIKSIHTRPSSGSSGLLVVAEHKSSDGGAVDPSEPAATIHVFSYRNICENVFNQKLVTQQLWIKTL